MHVHFNDKFTYIKQKMKRRFLLFYNAMSTAEVMRCLIRVNILKT